MGLYIPAIKTFTRLLNLWVLNLTNLLFWYCQSHKQIDDFHHLLLLCGYPFTPRHKPGQVKQPWRHVRQAQLLQGEGVLLETCYYFWEELQSEVGFTACQLLAYWDDKLGTVPGNAEIWKKRWREERRERRVRRDEGAERERRMEEGGGRERRRRKEGEKRVRREE